MTKKKSTHGGKRPGAGRKPIDEPREQLFSYPKITWLNALGRDKAREIAEKAIEKAYKKISKWQIS